MKKYILLLGLGLMTFTLNAQEEPNEPVEVEESGDTTLIKLKRTEIVIVEKKNGEGVNIETRKRENTEGDKEVKEKEPLKNYEGHWAGLDVGVNMFLNQAGNTSFANNEFLEIDPSRSWNWNLNFLEKRFKIAGSFVGLTTGMGINVTNFSFKDNYIYQYNSEGISAYKDSVVDYKKNKLRASYLTIPLLLEFHTSKNKKKSAYLSAGVVGGVKLGSKLKRFSDQEGYETKFRQKGNFGLNPFKLDGIVRIGIGSWGIYGSVNLLPTFDTKLTATAHQASFGLSYSF